MITPRRPSNLPTVRPAVRDLRREVQALTNAYNVYKRRFGWAVNFDRQSFRITTTAGDALSAILMPEPLANAVMQRLIAARQPVAVLANGQGRWLTLLAAQEPAVAVVPADLERAGVRLLPRGTPVGLPVPGRVGQDARWVTPPNGNGALPRSTTVMSLVRECVGLVV